MKREEQKIKSRKWKIGKATYMKKAIFYFLIIFVAIGLAGCSKVVQHDDPFYNDGGGDAFPYTQFPLIKPYYVYSMNSASPWRIDLTGLWVNTADAAISYDVEDLEKISVQDGVIMAYSPYVDEQAPQSIRDDYYHWFVIVPDQNITMGFHDEEAFQAYIHQLGIQNPDWITPNDAIYKFSRTGCLPWIPDCE